MANSASARSLKEWRKSRGQTQREAAVAVGIHPTTWCLIERGKNDPTISLCGRIAAHFGCAIEDIAFPSLNREAA